MPQGILSFKDEEEAREGGLTALGGLPAYLDLAHVVGLRESINRHVRVRPGEQGWTDAQVILSLILLNLAGDDSVEDLGILEGDKSFCRVLKQVETHGMRRRERAESFGPFGISGWKRSGRLYETNVSAATPVAFASSSPIDFSAIEKLPRLHNFRSSRYTSVRDRVL